MADFDVSEAALSGLKLIGRKPKVLAFWMAFNLIAIAGYLALVFWIFGDVFRSFVELIAQTAASRDDSGLQPKVMQLILTMIPRIGLAILTLFPLALLYQAIRQNAATRAILKPDDDRFGYLRIGADELRSAVVILALGLIRFVIQMVYTAGMVAVVAVLAGAQRSAGNAIGAQFLEQILQLPMYAILIYMLLKFAFAVPLTLDTGRINIFESWTMTRGHTLRMLLAYLIVVLIAIVVGIVAGLVGFGFIFAAGASKLASIIPLFETDVQGALTQLFGLMPGLIVAIAIVSAIFAPIMTALYYCPAAYIYQRVAGRTEDVF